MATIELELERRGAYQRPRLLDVDRAPKRTVTATTRQTRYVAMAAQMQARLSDVVEACYETDTRGRLWNVDPETGQILFGLPWATYSHREWGLYRSECEVLRRCVRSLRKRAGGPFYYDGLAGRWFLDLSMYPTLASLQANPAGWTLTAELVHAADLHRRGVIDDSGQYQAPNGASDHD